MSEPPPWDNSEKTLAPSVPEQRPVLEVETPLTHPPMGVRTDPSAPPDRDLGPGCIVGGRYEIKKFLGAGGMGQVYLALDTKLNEELALKVLLPELLRDKRALERFRNEVRLARKIKHDNVCRVYDLGEDGDKRFLTMELVEGRTLRQVIHEDNPPLEQIYQYLQQVCRGLAAVHKEGIVHRDLKPENILVRQTGETVIADFGLAKRTMLEDGTTIGAPGTPKYMSPEQIRSEQQLDARSDVFTFGIIAFELLARQYPFARESIPEIQTAILHASPPAFTAPELRPEVVQAVQFFLDCALAKSPTDRFPSAAEMCSAFEDAWAGIAVQRVSRTMPILARGSSPSQTSTTQTISSPPRQTVTRGRWFFSLFGIALLGYGVALVLSRDAKVLELRHMNIQSRDILQEFDWRPVVEVRPFKNSSGDLLWDSYATDSIRAHLRRSPMLRVMDAAASKGQPKPTWSIHGTVQRVRGKLHLLVEIHDANDASITRPIEVDGGPDEAEQIVKRLRIVLLEDLLKLAKIKVRDRRAIAGTNSEEARQNLFRYYLTSQEPQKEDLELGQKLLTAALAADPNYVPALVEHAFLSAHGVGVENRIIGVRRGLEDLERALTVAPKDSEALLLRCRLLRAAPEIEGKPTDEAIQAALSACTAALLESPDSPRMRVAFARVAERQCADDDAITSYEVAANLDPATNPDLHVARDALVELVGTALQNGRLQQAEQRSRELVEIEASLRNGKAMERSVHLLRGAVLLRLGRLDEAKEEFEREIDPTIPKIGDAWPEASAIRGLMIVAKKNGTSVPVDLLQRLETIEREAAVAIAADRATADEIAIIYQWTDPEAALRLLEQTGAPTNFNDVFRRALFLHEAGRDTDARKLLSKYTATQAWERSCVNWMGAKLRPER